MKYRKTLRLNDFDYIGDYISFITFRVANGQQTLSVIKDSLELTKEGSLVASQIQWLSIQYNYVKIHSYVIMPDHVHLLIEINASNTLAPNIVGVIF